MKTLLLLILLQISSIFALSPNDFIDRPISKFIDYCTEHKIDIYQNDKFYVTTIDKNTVICFFNSKIKAFKIYYPKGEYNIHKVKEILKNNLYLIKEGIYIDIDSPTVLYGSIDYKDEKFFALVIYKHGN